MKQDRLLNPITGKYFAWKESIEPVFSGHYNMGVERLHEIVRDLLLKKSYKRGSLKASSSPNTLARLFKLYDTDGSGNLDKEEFYQMLSDLGIQAITRTDYNNLFRKYDIDGDGTISYKEWAQAYCSHFTCEEGVLDLPSTKLDIKHMRMDKKQALSILRKDIIRVLARNELSMEDLVTWSYLESKDLTKLSISEVKKTLRGHFHIGIGNEAALDLLLEYCKFNYNLFCFDRFKQFMKTTQLTQHSNKRPISARRPVTTNPSRSRPHRLHKSFNKLELLPSLSSTNIDSPVNTFIQVPH